MTDRDPTPPPPWPLMSEDGDWFAFPAAWSRRQCVSEVIHNLADWWVEDFLYVDDDDRCHGWYRAIRDVFDATETAMLRPARENEYGFSDDWWYEDPAGFVPAWVVRL